MDVGADAAAVVRVIWPRHASNPCLCGVRCGGLHQSRVAPERTAVGWTLRATLFLLHMRLHYIWGQRLYISNFMLFIIYLNLHLYQLHYCILHQRHARYLGPEHLAPTATRLPRRPR